VILKTIIAVHTPKTAGSSFLHQIKQNFSEDEILLDYAENPAEPLSRINIDPNYYKFDPIKTILPHNVVYGHFHPNKYAYIENAFRMTFLRHPIENVVSIYFFWMAHNRNFWNSPIFQYCKDMNLSLNQYAALPMIRYLYTRTYFGNYNMKQFDFIGDYTNYDEELLRLGNLLGLKFDLTVHLNVTSEYIAPSSGVEKERSRVIEIEFASLKEVLKEDIEFYEEYKGK
jgi:hypothetical protein